MNIHNKALLPVGFYDLLGSEAELHSRINQELTALFTAYGYELVQPPLMEFESSLLGGEGKQLNNQTFRVMDPLSHKMMGMRADMTAQIARIASTLRKDATRPLRLCYAGQVLHVKATDLHADRQLGQAGVELVGAPSAKGDVEAVLIALDSLERLGIQGVSVDFSLPSLAKMLLAELHVDAESAHPLSVALQKKDIDTIRQLGGEWGDTLATLAAPAGSVEETLALLKNAKLPKAAKPLYERLEEVIDLLRQTVPDSVLTIDPLEFRQFHYHTGIAFSLFSKVSQSELGRGGRYRITHLNENQEEAVGFTLYVNTLCRIVAPAESKEKRYISVGTSLAEIRKLQEEGYTVVFTS